MDIYKNQSISKYNETKDWENYFYFQDDVSIVLIIMIEKNVSKIKNR